MFQPCSPNPDPTCEELEALEQSRAADLFNNLCSNGGASLPDLLQLFFKPPHASNQPDQQRAVLHLLTRQPICHPANNLAVQCDDPCEDPVDTLCNDPDECPSKFFGYGLLEVIRAAVRADSMVRIPYAYLDAIMPGESLVWAPAVTPENTPCDPCETNTIGAFVPEHIYLNPPVVVPIDPPPAF